jgi:hypothetical protein
VVRFPGYTTEMYCASCEVRTEFICVMWKKLDGLCGLVVRVPGYRCRGTGFGFRRYQIFCVVGLERGPLCHMNTIEELLERNSSCYGLEIREYGREDPLR